MMGSAKFNESTVEDAVIFWLQDLGYSYIPGPDIAPDGTNPERASYTQVVLSDRLRSAANRLNPNASQAAVDEAVRQIEHISHPSLIHANRDAYKLITQGVEVEVQVNGETRGETIHLIDFDDPARNEFLVVNQYTVIDGTYDRRPDVVVFVNGLPLAVIELKNPNDAGADLQKAWNQLQTYHLQIPALFRYNQIEVIADGLKAELGCIYTPKERFSAWKTKDGKTEIDNLDNPLAVLIKGVFEPARFLELIRRFIVFEDDGTTIEKKIAQYHQFFAVEKAVETVVRASRPNGNRRGGVLWHTQGSGKSLTMLWFSGKLARHPDMENPTIVVVTDRIDLDDQLHKTFLRGSHVLRQIPIRFENRRELRESLLGQASGGVFFTTIQKFLNEDRLDEYPLLSDRSNIVVITDEAHRSQYNFLDGTAKNMREALPNATYVGFTGTPIDNSTGVTTQVFGDYIDIYDIKRAVEDGSTVPIYYESQLVRLELPPGKASLLDDSFDDITEAEEVEGREKLKTRWAQLEVLVGSEPRIKQIAAHLVEHFENRRELRNGKGMVVCMSRRIAIDLYKEIARLRPNWHTNDDTTGRMKIIMTGAATDPLDWQQYIGNSARREALAKRFKDPNDEFNLAIVRDMWLTGFDVPPLDTMYIDKPMQGHGLMQAIARVNRVFGDKPGGLVVDYIGLANKLKEALARYVQSGGTGNALGNSERDELIKDQSLNVMLGKLDLCRDYFKGLRSQYQVFIDPTSNAAERLELMQPTIAHILMLDFQKPGSKDGFLKASKELHTAYKLCGADRDARSHRLEVAFFLCARNWFLKAQGKEVSDREVDEMEYMLRKLVDQAILPKGITDVFKLAGLDRPDISVLSEGFLAEVAQMPHKSIAAEILRKMLEDELGRTRGRNIVESKRFSERLTDSMLRYHNRTIETVEVIEELIKLAKELREAQDRGVKLGLTDDELAYYDALGENQSAVEMMGDQQLLLIAREVAETVRNNTTIDWSIREQSRANLRRMVRRTLKKYGYPPDLEADAIKTVIEQAEHITNLNVAA